MTQRPLQGRIEEAGSRQRTGGWPLLGAAIVVALALGTSTVGDETAGPPDHVEFSQSAEEVGAYDSLEISLRVVRPTAVNPFTDVSVVGEFFKGEESERLEVDGFCDSPDGSLYRVRFLPVTPGEYSYAVTYRQGEFERFRVGKFSVTDGGRNGLLRVDPVFRWHFIWEGTGDHYFWNGATAYYLLGWQEDTIHDILERFHRLKVNRVRVLLYGRSHGRPWGTPVFPTESFKPWLNPWVARRPDDVDDPGFDLSRFNVEHWRKFERMLELARERDIVVSVVFFLGGQVLPTPFAALSADERRYLRYAIARLSAFSNVTWDLGHEHDFHRSYPDWADDVGYIVRAADPYDHLVGAHNGAYRTEESWWTDMQLLQRWDGGQNFFMIGERKRQARTGHIVPQVNEGYGFEDQWEKYPGQRAADTRRRLAWEIYMAGCYQTTGESARQGTGVPPDTGGGWVNGRGDDSMILLEGYSHIVKFFTTFEWWKAAPRNDLTNQTALCLANAGEFYALYLPEGGSASVRIEGTGYRALWFQPRSGEWLGLSPPRGPIWSTPVAPDGGDWAALVVKESLLPDREPLEIETVSVSGSGREVIVVFSEPVTKTSAEEPGHYLIRPKCNVSGATLDVTSGRVATLHTHGLVDGGTYTLKVWGVRDRSSRRTPIEETAIRRFRYTECPEPVVKLRFAEGVGRSAANTGKAAASHADALLTGGRPVWSANVPTLLTGGASLDFGANAGLHAAELRGGIPEDLHSPRSLTIAGWLNSRFRSGERAANCVLSTLSQNEAGFELDVSPRGALRFSIGERPQRRSPSSSPEKIPTSLKALQDNWRFFAVTYDASEPENQVRFYIGTPAAAAVLDRRVTWDGGPIVFDADSVLTVGHLGRELRALSTAPRGFRGLVDDITIYASSTDASGALSLEQIRCVQQFDASLVGRE